MKLLFFVFLLITCFLIINCQNRRKGKSAAVVDDDEFAEFDDLFDDNDDPSKKTEKKKTVVAPAADTKQHQQQKEDNRNDFDEIDITLEDENDDNEEEPVKAAPSTKSPATPSTATKETQQQQKVKQPPIQQQDLDNEEFENFVDDEEFEGFDDQKVSNSQNDDDDDDFEDVKTPLNKKKTDIPDLKIAKVPEHLLHTNDWKNYYLELIMIAGILVYIANMIVGKTKNSTLAQAWFESNREILESNFALVGDDGTTTDIAGGENTKLIKESDNIYGLWCSGRQSCLNMFIQLKFIKRQDLISVVSRLIKPQNDQIIINVEFDRKDLDSYVFCLANRKQSSTLMKDYQDLAAYCTEKKQVSDNFGIDSKYVLINEIGEIPAAILDARVCAFLKKNPDLIDYILISDQYVGYKLTQDDQANVQNKPQVATAANGDKSVIEEPIGLQNSRAMMVICINISKTNKYSVNVEDIEKIQPALQFAFYLIDKVPRIILSKEGKAKAIKRRKDINEQNMKLVHKQRQEALQLKKEEKRRAEKEKIMNESDPEKQRKLEEQLEKREKKKGQSKMKQVKIKSM